MVYWCQRANVTHRQLLSIDQVDGGLLRLHEADKAAVDWLTTYGS